MPAQTITIPGLLLLAQTMLTTEEGIGSTILIDLIGSSAIMNDGSELSDYTLCSFEGYVQIPLSVGLFTAAVITSSYVSVSYSLNPVSWSNTSAAETTIYGYTASSASAGVVLWNQLFDTPRTLLPTNRFFLPVSLSIYPFINYTPPD